MSKIFNLQFSIYKLKDDGQVVIILLLIIIVSLAVALSVITKSVSEISTATKTEESSRAFSAAEAGIERAAKQYSSPGGATPGSIQIGSSDLNNLSKADVDIGAEPQPNTALEYPPFGKEGVAQFWFINPSLTITPNTGSGCSSTNCYQASSFDLYFGERKDYTSELTNSPAVEVNVIYIDQVGAGGKEFFSKKYLIDTYPSTGTDSSRTGNGFLLCSGNQLNPTGPPAVTSYYGTDRQTKFYCRYTISGFGQQSTTSLQPVMARVKLLYTNTSHPVMVRPIPGNSLPLQANYFRSIGSAGNSQRTVQLFTEKAVMPYWLDYVLFSAGQLRKDSGP